MAVLGPDGMEIKGFTIEGTYDNSAYGVDSTDAKGATMGEMLSDGTAKLTLPGKAITKETREETEFHMTSFTEVNFSLCKPFNMKASIAKTVT